MTTVARVVGTVQARHNPPAPIAEPICTSCPTRQAVTVSPTVPPLTTSKLEPTAYHVTRPVRPAMVSPVPIVTPVLMGSTCTAGIAGMCVQKRHILIRPLFNVKAVTPSVDFVLVQLLTIVRVVRPI